MLTANIDTADRLMKILIKTYARASRIVFDNKNVLPSGPNWKCALSDEDFAL